MTRARTSEVLHGSRTEEAFAKFELLERRADFAEGSADAGADRAEKPRRRDCGASRRRRGRCRAGSDEGRPVGEELRGRKKGKCLTVIH